MLGTVQEDPWKRLGRLVRERREHEGLTLAQVSAAGGPSTATLGLIEHGKQDGYKQRIVQKLEDALGWKRGSVRDVLNGGDPSLIEDSRIVETTPGTGVTVRAAEDVADDPTLLAAAEEVLEEALRLARSRQQRHEGGPNG